MRLDLVTEPGKVSHLTKRWEASIMKPSAFALGLFVGFAACSASADTITDWNKTTHDVMRAANVASNPASRALAMVHVAMSDAVNGVQDRYARYLPDAAAAPGASAEAAAATAARQILIQLFPNQKALAEEAYAASLKAIPDGVAKSDGVALGEKVAAAVQADRAGDGTNVPDSYRPLTTPGIWVPTTPPLFAEYARVKPWGLKSADQFRPGPPPALSSPLYARDYNETKTVGGTKSAARTPEQTRRCGSGPRPISARPGRPRRASSRPRRASAWRTMPGSSRSSTWASPTPSSPIGMPSSPTISGGR